jgi:hypothetical protein
VEPLINHNMKQLMESRNLFNTWKSRSEYPIDVAIDNDVELRFKQSEIQGLIF